MTARELASRIDYSLLRADATYEDIRRVCRETRKYGFNSVCVLPAHVRLATSLLRGTRSYAISVAGYPLGASRTETKVVEASAAVRDGAREIDMVMNIGALKSRDYALVERDVRAVARAVHAKGARLKVIIECAYLTDAEKGRASRIAAGAGADFIKTGTGYAPGAARPRDVRLIRKAVGKQIGIKAAGGIRSARQALALIAAGADRIGTSSAPEIFRELRACHI